MKSSIANGDFVKHKTYTGFTPVPQTLAGTLKACYLETMGLTSVPLKNFLSVGKQVNIDWWMDEYKTYKKSATTNNETAVSCSHRKATLVQRLLWRERDISNQVTSRAVFDGQILNSTPARAVFRSKLEPTSIIQVKFYKC